MTSSIGVSPGRATPVPAMGVLRRSQSPTTKQQAADAVAVARDEREIIQANLLDLDGSFGRRLLAGATLTGITKQRWESAAGALAALWDLYEAYSPVIDRAAETLARRPSQKGLAEITALLTGPSIEIDRELLWTAPCDLAAEADAVNRFQQAVLAIGAQQL